MKKISTIFLILILSSGTCFAQKTEYRLQPADVIEITVHDQPDLMTTARITADGNITFPLINKVKAKGLTVGELEASIKRLLELDYLVTAPVIVFIKEYHVRQVSVLGEVNNPGTYNMPEERNVTLLEAIALAGGFNKDADIDKTKVMRIKDGEKTTTIIKVSDITKRGKRDQDIEIKPEDVIFVSESFF